MHDILPPSDLPFRQWFEGHGGSFHPAIVLDTSPSGTVVKVRDEGGPIEAAAVIVRCPTYMMISFAHASQSRVLRSLIERDPDSTFGQIIALRFYLVEQYLLGADSWWAAYIRSLPQPYDANASHATPIWAEQDVKWLEKTNVGKATSMRKDIWHDEFTQAKLILERTVPDFAKKLTW